MSYILGISCFYHDSAAVLIKDGEILHAVQEERFTRIRHDAAFPIQSILNILEAEKISIDDVEAIVYYEKPFVTFERLVESYLAFAPRGFPSFLKAMPLWLKEKLFFRRNIKQILKKHFPENKLPPLKFSEHHLSHAASAFFASGFEKAAVLCVDGVGEWATTSLWKGSKSELEPLWEIHYPHSLGLLYSTITGYLGFKVNSGEYKVMGLAPYGDPKYYELMRKELITLHSDGSYSLNLEYFSFHYGLKMYSPKLEKLFGRKARTPESNLDQFHMDVAASLQKLLEEILIHIIKFVKEKTGEENLCLAGGVALNCVANSRLLKTNLFREIWVQPAAGDAGGALGAALAYYHLGQKHERKLRAPDQQKGSFLGPEFSDEEIKSFLNENKIPYEELSYTEMLNRISNEIISEKIIGWFQGRMEFGPRALGHRSIIGDARVPDMQKRMNLKIKFRESFRPFAPVLLEEDSKQIFDFKVPSPYMLFTADVLPHLRTVNESHREVFGIERLNQIRSIYPSITHIDFSARLQTVSKSENPVFHDLLNAYKEKTGHSVLVNTSFNVRGEPIVCSPLDAYRCFRRTDIDVLVLNNFIITKKDLPSFDDSDWKEEFKLD